jgi:copper oxidase (laccase) domain-containing protein
VIASFDERLLGSALEGRMDPRARSRMEVRHAGGVLYLVAELPGVFRSLFTTRLGGVSEGLFATLNLDIRSSDDPAAVECNRSLVMGILGEDKGASCGEGTAGPADPRYRFVSPAQAHGVRVVGAAEYVRDYPDTPCDGLTLNPNLDRGLAALLMFADCVPVVLASEVDMAVVHGGWRGILGGVVQQAGRSMTGPPGTAVIGPSIGPCCFTVGEEVARGFSSRFGPEVVILHEEIAANAMATGECPPGDAASEVRANAFRVDLWAAVAKAVAEMGVGEDQIVNPRLCTACNTDFFYSYRREGPVTGRQGCLGWAAVT